MATRQIKVSHSLGGGLASDFGPNARVSLEGGVATIPFLLEAKDIFYTLNDGFRKIGGTERIGAQFGGGTDGIDSLHDYWYTNSGNASQRRVAYAGASLYVDNGDGVFTSITSAMASDAKVHFSQFDEDLIIMSSNPGDVPQVYDGTTLATLGSNTPNGQFSAVHKNRLWLAGDPANLSRLYYSETLPNGPRGDWGGADSGSIDINPGDGDEIRGLVSYKNNLWVFKGPNRGSIHRIEGSSPTGTDPFARRDFLESGLPAVAPNGFFLFRDDLGFITADGSIHSLKATASFGDFNVSSLTQAINQLLGERINRSALRRSDAAAWVEKGLVLFAVPFDGSGKPNVLLAMDYRFNPVRWSIWEDYDAQSITAAIDGPRNSDVTVLIGGADQVVRRIDQKDAANAPATGSTHTAITGRVITPFLSYGGPKDRFGLHAASVYATPDGFGTVSLSWSRDGKSAQSETLAAQGSPLLGTTFVLGSSELGRREARARHTRTESGGEFNQIQYQISNGVLTTATDKATGQRMAIDGFEVLISPAGDSLEND